MTVSVLMVCLGNICRSPMAEAAFRHHAGRLGLDVNVDSAGTGGWHAGDPPDHRAQEVARRLGGVEIGDLRARQVRTEDFVEFDYLLAMDSDNLRALYALRPSGATGRIAMLDSPALGADAVAVDDPYYGDSADFERCWRHVDRAAYAFAMRLLEGGI